MMSTMVRYGKVKNLLWVLVFASLFAILLAACGPEPEVYYEPEQPEVVLEEDIEDAPIKEAPIEADAEPDPEEPAPPEGAAQEGRGAGRYQHPSGAFSMSPYSDDYQEAEDMVVFSDVDSTVIVGFTEADFQIDDGNFLEFADSVLDDILVGEGFLSGYEILMDYVEAADGGFYVPFENPPTNIGETEGELFLVQEENVLYALILLSVDYASVEDYWYAAIESFMPGSTTTVVEISQGEGEPAPEGGNQSPEPQPAESGIGLSDEDADSGFRPDLHGFNFENYGDETSAVNLTAVEMQRMFGDAVCANMAGGECGLTPAAREWMEQANQTMDGGHCEGMAVLSELMYFGQINPAAFGAAAAHDLNFANEILQREIAYWFVTQATNPGGATRVDASPSAVVDTLMAAFEQGFNAAEWWVLGFYMPDGSGGHAVTPLAVDDKGDGTYNILVYDNNFPNEIRAVEVDYQANTWKYQASINPDVPEELYEGDASTQTLEIVALTPRLQQQDCHFCEEGWQGMNQGGGLAVQAQRTYEIWLHGDADLLIIDEQGNRLGYADGEFVDEIPGASSDRMKFGVDVWASDYEPVYRLPVGVSFEIVIDGSRLEEAGLSEVSMIGPGYFLSVDEIWLEPGEMDSIVVTIDGGRQQLTYVTDYNESPVIMMGVETEQADYAFLVQATELTGIEDTFDVAVDLATNEFILNTSFNTDPSTYDFYVLRIDDEGESAFGISGFRMEPENTVYLQFTSWMEDGGVMYADVDFDNDGEIDSVLELPDEADEFEWQ